MAGDHHGHFIESSSFASLQAIICVARSSGRRQQEFIDTMHENNRKLYDYFQMNLHAKFHTCASGDCKAEFRSIVFNGYSSNTGIALPGSNEKSNQALSELSHVLRMVSSMSSACAAVLLISEEDGFFTNVASMRAYFAEYLTLNITIFVYKGHDQFHQYQLSEVLDAVDDISQGRLLTSPSHQLVLTWIQISLNKEVVAQALRANKEMMPRSRNTIGTFEPAPQKTDIRAYTKSDISKRLQDTSERRPNDRVRSLIRYDLEKIDDTFWLCPQEACTDHFADFEGLVKHLVSQTRQARCCVLCEPGQFTDMNCESHIRSHLPPALKCSECDYVTRTRRTLRQHLATHGIGSRRPNKFECQYDDCDFAFPSQRDLDRHVASAHTSSMPIVECDACGAKLRGQKGLDNHRQHHCEANGTVHICKECQRSFDTYSAMKSHVQAAHHRRDQVVGFAVSAGLIDSDAGILQGVQKALQTQ